ncbi:MULTISPECIES: SDR family NAD(P)-dependent oxidoreductase [Allofournierella]|uniref:SDR family NAD(P)-dependent oxidoreductase n=1 Tax=Allofournierella TaxID=1940255 RepID=UPI002E76170D|nr:glucose 1-dehydrogenase [Fournierella sp.]MEE0756683.1 glucose 1-dehydrogenase [Fournierella sp.]
MKRLENKVAIITGAAMGQGAAEAYLFAKEGAKVVAADMAEDALKETVDAINADFPGMALGVHLDVASEENWQQVVKQAVETFGTVDILVNNAGVGSRGINYDKTDREAFDRIMGINAWGSFAGIKTVVPVMKKAGGGSIVNVSSLAAVVGVEFNAYTLTKGAVVSMTRAAAVDLGKDNIRVNTIIPGTIVTPMTKIICDYPKVLKSCEEKTCLGHIGEPNDIAYGVLYLASDEAKYVTGSDLTIDGGERFKDALELEL